MNYPAKRPATANELTFLTLRCHRQKKYLLLLTGLFLFTLLLVFAVIGSLLHK